MKVDVVQIELKKKCEISLDGNNEYIYGVESSKNLFVNEIGKSNVEMVGVICMDSTNKILNYSNIAIGGIKNVKVPVAQIFKVALLSNASQIIIAHNHPSGVLKITEADINMTKNIGKIAAIFDINLIDSLVLNADGDLISIREHIEELK